MSARSRRNNHTYLLAAAITIGLCAFWGLAHGVYGHIFGAFNRFFGLSPLEHYLTSASFPLAYVIAAIPAALFSRRFGFKLAIIFGLGAFSLGAFLFYPAVAQHQVVCFVAAVIATSIGWCFLETSANPLICSMGSPQKAVQRLNFAQAFYPVGYVTALCFGNGIAVPRAGILDADTIETLVQPYVLVGLVVVFVAFLIENVEFPPVALALRRTAAKPQQELRALLLRREFQFALAAMCATMLGLVIVISVAGKYVTQTWPEVSPQLAPNTSLVFWVVVGIGRFSGAGLMGRFDPLRLVTGAAAACIVTLGLAQVFPGLAGVACLFGTALFLSITFPTIFGEAIRDTGDLTKSAAGLLVIAAGIGSFSGGNFAAWALRAGHMHLALTAAALCYAAILLAVLAMRRLRSEIPAEPQD